MKNKSMIRGRPANCLLGMPAFVVFKAGQYVEQCFAELFANTPIRARHFAALRVLHYEKSLTQQQLCESLWIDRATMTGLIQELLKLGYVKRDSQENDKRIWIVSLTPAGQRFYKGNAAEFTRFERQIFAGLKRQDIRSVQRILSQALIAVAKM